MRWHAARLRSWQNAETFRFDASDAMPAAVADAFNAAIVAFAQNQGDLDAILERVDRVQAGRGEPVAHPRFRGGMQ